MKQKHPTFKSLQKKTWMIFHNANCMIKYAIYFMVCTIQIVRQNMPFISWSV